MKTSEKYTQPHLSGKELEKTSEQMLDALHDRQLRKRWQQQLKDDYQMPPRRRTSVIRKLRPWLAIAASLALILSVVYLWPVTPKDQYALLDEYLAQPFANKEGRKSDAILDSLRSYAIAAYTEGNFSEAARLRQQLVDRDSAIIEEDVLYLGLSYLYQDPPQGQAAIPHLERARQWPFGKFTAESRWFLALAYLQAEQIPAARQVLEEIAASNWRTVEAEALLKQLPE
ncbi:MAG: hypothetical protein AAFP77_10345 [Bacteroidota bacterium]